MTNTDSADAFAYFAQGVKQMNNVESPNHYTAGYFETIYEIRDILGGEGFKAFCLGNYIKYSARANHKGLRAEDLAKADQYLDWSVNGLPSPVEGRVPRAEQDRLVAFSAALEAARPKAEGASALNAGNALHEAVERAVTEAATGPIDSSPSARTIVNSIGPNLQKLVGAETMKGFRLRVTKDRHECEKHGNHIGFTAYIYDRDDDDEISRAVMLTDDPPEELCEVVATMLATDISNYLS